MPLGIKHQPSVLTPDGIELDRGGVGGGTTPKWPAHDQRAVCAIIWNVIFIAATRIGAFLPSLCGYPTPSAPSHPHTHPAFQPARCHLKQSSHNRQWQ